MKKTKQKARVLRSKTVLLVVTGSIAAYKAGDLIRSLQSEGGRVLCVMTESAKEFITPLTLKTLSGEKVYHDFFSYEVPQGVVHTSLAETSDLVLVAPASANFIARLAAGFANDLASCIILATKAPVVIVPAMNDRMYQHPITQGNIEKLKTIGYHFIDPVVGRLACGKEAVGHIADFSNIVSALHKIVKR